MTDQLALDTPPPNRPAPVPYPAGAGRPAIEIVVLGTPVGQGAISYNPAGHGYHANDKVLKPWRAKVTAAAVEATGRHAYAAPKKAKGEKKRPLRICTVCQVPANRHGLLLGAVRLDVIATFARPKSAPTRAYPIVANLGDWDHHGRSISDALTGVVFADDAQIIDGRAIKTYPGGHPDALTEPGAVIRVWEVSA